MKSSGFRARLMWALMAFSLGSAQCSGSGADGRPPSSSGEAGAGGASGSGSPGAGSGGAPGGAGGAATTPGGAGSGGSPGPGGAAGSGGGGFVLPPGPYAPLLDLDPGSALDQLPPERLVEACLIYNEFLRREIPEADQLRAACVVDAVFSQGALTAAACEAASQACIDALGTLPPSPCVEPEAGFVCTATIAEYTLCANELATQKQGEVALLVCDSLDVPDIQARLDAAAAPPASCLSFAEDCPGFFPIAVPPDGGAP